MTREEAIEILSGVEDYAVRPIDYKQAIHEAIWALKDPEIIRCKDCRYAEPDYGSFCCIINNFEMDANDWCSRARRREA